MSKTKSVWDAAIDPEEINPTMWEEMMEEIQEWLDDGEDLAGYDDESDEGETA